MKKLILYIFAVSISCLAQQFVVKTDKGTTSIPINTSISATVDGKNIIDSKSLEGQRKQWIVELTSPSALQTKNKFSVLNATAQNISVQQKVLASIPQSEIRQQFSVVLNGFAITATTSDIDKIRSVSGIKSIYEDLEVSTSPYDLQSVSLSTIPSSTLTSAKEVKVGVIDTGIDYMHEALGGGFGVGYKISGGYDFVNNDADPMDDNGHGTHVAGIIAGNSDKLHGIAQNAHLYAYKALDSKGNGSASKVIAAIEQAIKDSVDIINLSLGSAAGNPNDALCLAVNRAVEAGIVVVVAAGNTGEYESINSPGMATNALTVGASDGNAIATFSAKGPVPINYEIKPDVIAPGVGILSAKNGGGYVSMSGTSMATPFVAAIAAVLKAEHPEWSAFEIKDAIITSAKAMQTSLFAQGNGKVNNDIVIKEMIVSPAHLSYGFNSPVNSDWTKTDTITLFNSGTVKKSYNLSYTSANPALTITCTPSVVDIDPLERKQVLVSVKTNNLFLANNKVFSDGYTGNIIGIGTEDTLNIPFTFFKGNILHIEFSEAPWQVLIHNQKNFSKTIAPKSSSVSIVLNQGTYDIVTSFFGSCYVIRENTTLNGFTDVAIQKSEAVYQISMLPADENDNKLSYDGIGTYNFIEGIMYKPMGYAYVGIGGGMLNSLCDPVKYFSSMSDKYSFGYALTMQYGNLKSYTFDFALDSGISESKEINYSSSDLRKVELKYSVESAAQKIFPIAWTSFVGSGSAISVTFYDGNDLPLSYPYVQTSYYSNKDISFPIYHYREAYKY